ncbi:MAG: DUF1707 domain-containing protein [Gemmatimonadaceae bacterium]
MYITPVDPLRRAEELFVSGSAHPVSIEDARERAIRVLTDAYAYDAITEGEFEWRLADLMRATTSASLDGIVADLMNASTGLTRIHDRTPVTEGRITGIMSEVRRRGAWRVPERLHIRAFMSDMKVDFRYAVIPEMCVVNLKATMSSVQVIVAPGMSVGFDVNPFMGSATSDATDIVRTRGGVPDIRIVGSALMAEVKVVVRSRAS